MSETTKAIILLLIFVVIVVTYRIYMHRLKRDTSANVKRSGDYISQLPADSEAKQ